MKEPIELLNQTLFFSPLLLSIACVFFLHFGISWVRSAKKTQWKIDFWYPILFIQFVVPIICLYPFSASIYNFFAVKDELCVIRESVDRAAMISFIGYAFLWVGRVAHRFFKPFLFEQGMQLMERFTTIVEANLKCKAVLRWVLILSSALAILSIVIAQSLWDPRSFYLENHHLRPIYNLTLSLFPFTFFFLTVHALQEKKAWLHTLLYFFFLFSIFLGVRGILFAGVINFILAKAIQKRGQLKILPVSMVLFGSLFFLIFLNYVRHQEFSPALIIGTLAFKIFYGTTFSDIRDFAWVLSRWDETLLWGKSYLSGFLSFVPRAWSPFRQEWSLSQYTNAFLYFDSEKHPGLRPGPFGEAYLNFGIVGVIIVAFIGGYILSYVDSRIKQVMKEKGDLAKAFSKTILFFLCTWLFSSQAMWSIYLCIFFHLFLQFIRRIKAPVVSSNLDFFGRK